MAWELSLRLLVYPHELVIGGSQINAIDLAAGVAAKGHDVIVYGVPGPLEGYILERGLRFIPARRMKYRPAPSRIAQLASIAEQERIDLIHTYEWSACLDAYFGAALFKRVPTLCTVLSMQVAPYIPPSTPLIMGTAELGVEAQKRQLGDVWVLEPPIDVSRDHPEIDGKHFRFANGIGDRDFLVVSVSRLAVDLKLDALVRLIDAIDQLAGSASIRLVLVGDGPARGSLEARAAAVNNRHGRTVVTLTGADLDPRKAYAAADVVVGMGSSALRALAIGRPLVVQGERAFSQTFEPTTSGLFLSQGFYGLGDDVTGVEILASQIADLMVDPEKRERLGKFGREFVCRRFSLDRAVDVQLEIYHSILDRPPSLGRIEALRVAALALALEVKNHNPLVKRERNTFEAVMLATAKAGNWPPRPSR